VIELSKRQGPLHLLYVTTHTSGYQLYRIKCLGVTTFCQSRSQHNRCFFEIVAEPEPEAEKMFTAAGWQHPAPGVYLVRPEFVPLTRPDEVFELVWTGAARLKMEGNLFDNRLPHPSAVYVGRQAPHRRRSRWANPFKAGRPIVDCWAGMNLRYTVDALVRDNAHAVELFTELVSGEPTFTAEMRVELAGRVLACWCTPGNPCHGDTELVLANQNCLPDGEPHATRP
jgi:Domain of unknown function (DUF4326)